MATLFDEKFALYRQIVFASVLSIFSQRRKRRVFIGAISVVISIAAILLLFAQSIRNVPPVPDRTAALQYPRSKIADYRHCTDHALQKPGSTFADMWIFAARIKRPDT